MRKRTSWLVKRLRSRQQASNLKERLNEFEKEVFSIPDGRINRVNSNLKTVIVNIGKANGLKVNRNFSVYDRSVNNFEKGREKASIEVIYLIGDNAAEARITERRSARSDSARRSNSFSCMGSRSCGSNRSGWFL